MTSPHPVPCYAICTLPQHIFVDATPTITHDYTRTFDSLKQVPMKYPASELMLHDNLLWAVFTIDELL